MKMKLWLLLMLIAQSVICYIVGGGYFSVIASLIGVLYVFLVTTANNLNYIFGFINASMIFYLAYQTPVYGDMLFQGFMVLLNVVGMSVWCYKAYKGQGKQLKIKELPSFSDKEWKGIFVAFMFILAMSYAVLGHIGSARAPIDALTFTLGMTAMYSLIRGYKYQFMFWIMSNMIQVALWLSVSDYSEHALALGGMYTMYLLNSVVGLIYWSRK